MVYSGSTWGAPERSPLRFFHSASWDRGGVQQHDIQQVRRQAGSEDAALEALLNEHGDAAGVVDVGMGHKDNVNGTGREGELGVGHLVPSLLPAAVP